MLLRKVTFNKEAFLISHFSKRGGNLRNPGKPLGNSWETPQKHYSFFRFWFKNAGNCAGNPRNPWETQHFVEETFGNPFGTMHIHPPSETLLFLWIGLQKRLQLEETTETPGKPLGKPWETQHFVEETLRNPHRTMHIHPLAIYKNKEGGVGRKPG